MKAGSEVFFVIGSLQVGGTEIHLSMVTRELVKRGHRITVYNFSGAGLLGDAMSDAGVRIIDPLFQSKPGRSKSLNLAALSLSSVKLYLTFLFRRPEIVHFFLPQTYIIGAILARCAGLSRLVMSRRSLNEYQNRHPFLGRVERRLHRSMCVILGNSKRVIEQLHSEEHVPADKMGLIYNGVKLDSCGNSPDREEKRRQLDIAPSTLVLTIVANLIPYKGHRDLLQALSNIQADMPGDWTLLVVGRDDGIADDLKWQVTEYGLEKKIRFLGSRDDVSDLFSISDIGILCSHEEGFSNAILEAMATGLAMIVTDVGGNAEAVQDEVTGLVVEAHAPASLGAAILRLGKDRQLAARMGCAGRQRAEEFFSLDRCVAGYEALYKALVSDRALILPYEHKPDKSQNN